MFKKYKKLDDFARENIKTFERDINSIGLYKNKAKNIVHSAKKIKKEFGGRIPKTIAELITLPGVGRKTANVFLASAYNITEGIAVDTHVIRLSRQFGLTKHKDAKRIEQDLMKLIPKKEWRFFTLRMIMYGRVFSTARNKSGNDTISNKIRNNK